MKRQTIEQKVYRAQLKHNIITYTIIAADIIILAMIAFNSCSAQATCPPHQPEIWATVRKPVKYLQLVVPLETCDPDKGQTVTLSIVKGDPKKLFRIGAGGLLVNDAKTINRNSSRLYVITVQARDNGTKPKPLTRESLVMLLVR
jgi:hypothetical protein